MRRIKRDLFPTDQWFEIKARRQIYEKRAQTLQSLLMYLFDKHTRLKRNATPWIRQLVTLGTSPVKVVWKLDERQVRYLKESFDDEGHPTGDWETAVDTVLSFVGPTFRTVDLFSWYVFPYTCLDVDDASLVFEDLLVSKDRLEAMAKKPIHPEGEDKKDDDGRRFGHVYEHVDDLLKLFRPQQAKDKFEAEARRLADKGFTQVLDMRIPFALKPYDITECIWIKDLEGTGRAQRYLCAIGADEIILRVQRNPSWDDRAPWMAGKFVEVENEFYGRGLPELFDKMQYQMNDTADQGQDALTWSMNPIAIVDTYSVVDPQSYRMRPGAKWLAQGDPNRAVRFTEPPKEAATIGFTAVSQWGAIIDEVAGVAPLLAPQQKSRGRSQQSAAGAQLMQMEAAIDVRDIVECIEDQVLEPFLGRAHKLIEQHLDRKLVLQIEGADGASWVEKQVGVEDVLGDFEFDWLGSLKAVNEQIRAQQMATGLGIVSKIPPEALGNKTFDFATAIEDFFKIGLGLRKGYIKDKVPQQSIDWRLENDLFRLGRGADVVVAQSDNDVEHAQGHQKILEDKDAPQGVQAQVFLHIQAHVASYHAKEQMRVQAEAQQQGMKYAAFGKQAGPPGSNGAPPMGGGRIAQTGGLDDLYRRLPRVGSV